MIESVAGIMNAAPTPWTARPTISHSPRCEKAMKRLESAEDDDAGDEAAAAAEDVAQAPAGDEQHGEGQRVGVDRPLQARDGDVEVALDRRQRDVHDRVVEHDHEQREAHRAERPPAAVVVADRGEREAMRSPQVVRGVRSVTASSAAESSARRSGSSDSAKCSRPCEAHAVDAGDDVAAVVGDADRA